MGKYRRIFVCAFCVALAAAWLPGSAAAQDGGPKCFGHSATILGTAGPDVLRGTDGNDVVIARKGDDRVVTVDGHDLVCAGAGDDSITTGKENDLVDGGPGRDTILLGTMISCHACGYPPQVAYGRGGADVIDARNSSSLYGGTGDDRLSGGAGYDFFNGGSGNDRMNGAAGSNGVSFSGSDRGVVVNLARGHARGAGSDRIENIAVVETTRFDDRVVGDAGANVVSTNDGDDVVRLRGGRDYLDGGGGDDTLEGGEGNDRLYGKGGADDMDGGSGIDSVTLASRGAGVIVDLVAGTSEGSESETVIGIENVTTTRYPDTVLGTETANRIFTLRGADTIEAGAGDDYLEPGDGDDTVDGGLGSDIVKFDRAVQVDLAAGDASEDDWSGGFYTDAFTGIEGVIGSIYDDVLLGDESRNVFFAREGADQIDGRGGDDSIRGGRVLTRGEPCPFNDAIVQYDDGADTIHGGTGNDVIHGGTKVPPSGPCNADTSDTGDAIFGDSGDDDLFGDEGDDALDGGPGADRIDGGRGEDACVEGETVTSCEGG